MNDLTLNQCLLSSSMRNLLSPVEKTQTQQSNYQDLTAWLDNVILYGSSSATEDISRCQNLAKICPIEEDSDTLKTENPGIYQKIIDIKNRCLIGSYDSCIAEDSLSVQTEITAICLELEKSTSKRFDEEK